MLGKKNKYGDVYLPPYVQISQRGARDNTLPRLYLDPNFSVKRPTEDSNATAATPKVRLLVVKRLTRLRSPASFHHCIAGSSGFVDDLGDLFQQQLFRNDDELAGLLGHVGYLSTRVFF